MTSDRTFFFFFFFFFPLLLSFFILYSSPSSSRNKKKTKQRKLQLNREWNKFKAARRKCLADSHKRNTNKQTNKQQVDEKITPPSSQWTPGLKLIAHILFSFNWRKYLPGTRIHCRYTWTRVTLFNVDTRFLTPPSPQPGSPEATGWHHATPIHS